MRGAAVALLVLALLAGGLAGCAGTGLPASPDSPRDPRRASNALQALESEGPVYPGDSDLARLLAIAEEHSPAIETARAELRAAEGRLREARNYPNPSASVSSSGHREGGLTETGEQSLTLSQPIIIGQRRARAIAAAEQGVEGASFALEEARRAVQTEVRRLYLEVLYFGEASGLQMDLVFLAQDTLAAVEERGDAAARGDGPRARILLKEAELGVIKFASEQAYSLENLVHLLGGVQLRADQIQGQLLRRMNNELTSVPTKDLLRNHPDLQRAAAGVREAEEMTGVASAEVTPDITPSLSAGYDQEGDSFVGGVGVEVPIPLWDRNQGRIQEAQAKVRRALAEQADTWHRLESDLMVTLLRINEYDTLSQAYAEEIVPWATDAYDATLANYRVGQQPVLDVLAAQEKLFEARREALQWRWRLSTAHAELLGFQAVAPNEERRIFQSAQ